MMTAVHDALLGVDLVCLIRDAAAATGNGDRFVLDLVKQSDKLAMLLLNKTDKLKDKSQLLPLIEWYQSEHDWQSVVPISALKGDQIEQLLAEMTRSLPESDPLFAAGELTPHATRRPPPKRAKLLSTAVWKPGPSERKRTKAARTSPLGGISI